MPSCPLRRGIFQKSVFSTESFISQRISGGNLRGCTQSNPQKIVLGPASPSTYVVGTSIAYKGPSQLREKSKPADHRWSLYSMKDLGRILVLIDDPASLAQVEPHFSKLPEYWKV